jgi:ankyrin repeat protein
MVKNVIMKKSYYEQYHDATINQLNLALHTACKNNDIELVKFLLTSHELENHANIFSIELTGFQWACYVGNIELVKYFVSSTELEKNIDISSDEYGGLTSACLGGHLDIVQYFLEVIGKNLDNLNDIYGECLLKAAVNKHYNIISFIVINKNLQRNQQINQFLQEHPDENIEKFFALRDLNKNLNNELMVVENKHNIKKIKL